MKPTVQMPDFYAVGNDYAQAPVSAFYNVKETWTSSTLLAAAGLADTEANWSAISGNVGHLVGEIKNYQDGLCTELNADLSAGAFSADPWKNPEGFNKRTVLVDVSASYTADNYSMADVIFNVGETENEENNASATYGTNDPFVPDPKKTKKND